MKNFDIILFCKRASELIFNSGETQAELVEHLGLSNGSVANLKNKKGQIPSAETVCALAKYFNVSTDWLLGLTDVKINTTAENAYKLGCDVGYQAAKNQIMSFIEEMR